MLAINQVFRCNRDESPNFIPYRLSAAGQKALLPAFIRGCNEFGVDAKGSLLSEKNIKKILLPFLIFNDLYLYNHVKCTKKIIVIKDHHLHRESVFHFLNSVIKIKK